MPRALLFALCTLFGAGLAAFVLPAQAQKPGPAACPERLVGQDSLVCDCSAEAAASGSVWGDGIYTADSMLCRAARHAGAIDAYGGTVRARVVAGQASYPAATRNGIASGSWASYGASLAFER